MLRVASFYKLQICNCLLWGINKMAVGDVAKLLEINGFMHLQNSWLPDKKNVFRKNYNDNFHTLFEC